MWLRRKVHTDLGSVAQFSGFEPGGSHKVGNVSAGDEAKKTFGPLVFETDELDTRQVAVGIDIKVDVKRDGTRIEFQSVNDRGLSQAQIAGPGLTVAGEHKDLACAPAHGSALHGFGFVQSEEWFKAGDEILPVFRGQ